LPGFGNVTVKLDGAVPPFNAALETQALPSKVAEPPL
jgi:hypothetical protein